MISCVLSWRRVHTSEHNFPDMKSSLVGAPGSEEESGPGDPTPVRDEAVGPAPSFGFCRDLC